MAPKPDRLALTFGTALAMAVIATWAAPLNPESDSVTPLPPRETTRQAAPAVSRPSPRPRMLPRWKAFPRGCPSPINKLTRE